MPMTKSDLSTKLQTAIQSAFTISDVSTLKNACDAIADAIVTEIQTQATIVTTCPAGPGTGTIS